MTKIDRVFEADNYLGEGPIWSARDQALWWINCENEAEIHRWHPIGNDHSHWTMPKRVGGFVHKKDGNLLVVLADGLYDFNPTSGQLNLRVTAPVADNVLLHECHTDRQGRLWVGAYDHDFRIDNRDTARGYYFRLDGNVLTPMIDQITVANGLAFSPDGRTLYAGNSPTRIVDAWDLDPATGDISNRRRFLTLPDGEGFLDGATIDSEGGYWLALFAYGEIRRYLPDGRLDRTIALPFSNPTKPAFGGPDLGTLYITTTKLRGRADDVGHEQNGPLYALRPGLFGVTEVDLAD